jgi:phage gp46-like protein
MDFAIEIENGSAIGSMTLNASSSIMNNVYLSLMVKRGSFFQNLDFGSRLHLLHRAKNTERTAILAKEYCKEALQWLLDTGRATAIDVYTERDRRIDLCRLKLQVAVTQADGKKVDFITYVEVV